MKTLTVSDDTWKELTQMKLDLRHTTLDEVIKYLLWEVTRNDRN